MLKFKIILLAGLLLLISACSLFSKKKKKDKTNSTELVLEDSQHPENSIFENDLDAINTENYPTTDYPDTDSLEFVENIEIDEEEYKTFTDTWSPDQTIEDKVDTYSDVIANFQDEITKLQSELDIVTDEIYQLKAKSQIWENPFSIYNKEIILTNGSTVYGKITYQDQDIIYVETLIGGLTLQRQNVKRVIENITQLPDSTDLNDDQTRRNDILEIKKIEEGTIFQPTTKLLANAILIGDIKEEVDFRGNRILSGDIKNIGEARADFVKINFGFRMNWQGKTKSLTAFVRGAKHVFPDSNIESDSSIEISAVAGFELVIPADFGSFIGYSYSIDWEQYEE